MPEIPRSQKGVTLIELLIAITILAIGLLAISGMQITAIQANSFAQTLTVANSLASGIADDILSWDDTDSRLQGTGGSWDFDPDPAVTQTTLDVPGAGSYTATYAVNPSYDTNVAQITITVTGGRTTGIQAGPRSKSITILKRWTN